MEGCLEEKGVDMECKMNELKLKCSLELVILVCIVCIARKTTKQK